MLCFVPPMAPKYPLNMQTKKTGPMSKKKKKKINKLGTDDQKPWMGDSPVKAKKHLGQHFLKDEGIARQIAETLNLEGYRDVIEIGPGTGVLTKYLLERDLDLVAMDLDRESIDYLNHSFPLEHPGSRQGKGTFKVVDADFLK